MGEREHSLANATLGKASVDLNLADLALGNRETVEPWAVCFHAQQAAEKGIKACLIFEGVNFPKSHDLPRLLALLPADVPSPLTNLDAAWLTDFVTAGRYAFEDPAPGSDPDWSDATHAVEIARLLLIWARRRVEMRG